MNTRSHRLVGLFHAGLILLTVAIGSSCAAKSGQAKPRTAPTASASIDTAAALPGLPPIEPTVVSAPQYRDPLIRVNRAIFAFNDVTYRYLLIPISTGYTKVVPKPARRSIGNFFHNVKTPIYVVNDLLQLKPRAFGRHLSRFVINSTVGIGGLFDPAKAWFKLDKTHTGFEDTLARYGAGYGIYLVLPLLGSSDLRNGPGRLADYFLNPIPYVTQEPETTGIMALDSLQDFAPGAEKYKKLRREVEDPYIFFRNLYLQGVERDAEHH